MINRDVDIVIIGGGLTGAALMLALKQHNLSILLIDAHALSDKITADFDARSLALSPASQRILQMLGVWPRLANVVTPINTIDVSQQYGFGKTHLRADDQPLGFVVEMHHINKALGPCLADNDVIAPAQLVALNQATGQVTVNHNSQELTIQARLIVAADGSQSAVRRLMALSIKQKNYQQHAIIANIGLNRDHHNGAYERFTRSGPLAMLPLTAQRASLVWALTPADAAHYLTLSDNDFLGVLQQAFGYKLGRLVKVGKRTVYPLYQAVMPQPTAWPVVFIGNAAHTLHPVAGQGFNLGLRDVATLAQCIVQDGLTAAMLAGYSAQRCYDQRAISQFTDGLAQLFTYRFPAARELRSLGLLAVDTLPVLKNTLARHATGFAGIPADLICGINLQAHIEDGC